MNVTHHYQPQTRHDEADLSAKYAVKSIGFICCSNSKAQVDTNILVRRQKGRAYLTKLAVCSMMPSLLCNTFILL